MQFLNKNVTRSAKNRLYGHSDTVFTQEVNGAASGQPNGITLNNDTHDADG